MGNRLLEYMTIYRVFKNTEFYGGGKTSENLLNEPAELSLRCLAKTENDHCAAPCDTGVRDVGVPVEGIGNQMTPSSARALWGCALGGTARCRPTLHDARSCSGYPPLPGVGRPRWRLPAGRVSPSRLTKATAPRHRRMSATSASVVA